MGSIFRDVFNEFIAIAVIVIALVIFFSLMAIDWSSEEEKATRSHAAQIADELDRKIKSSGTYNRDYQGEINEVDNWGNNFQVSYSDEGVSEHLEVRSAGEDKKFYTDDDIIEKRMLLNMKGIGQGIASGVKEVSKNALKGAIRGVTESASEAGSKIADKSKDLIKGLKEKFSGNQKE